MANPKHKTHEENDMKTHNKFFKTSGKDKSLKEVRHVLKRETKNDRKFPLETI